MGAGEEVSTLGSCGKAGGGGSCIPVGGGSRYEARRDSWDECRGGCRVVGHQRRRSSKCGSNLASLHHHLRLEAEELAIPHGAL